MEGKDGKWKGVGSWYNSQKHLKIGRGGTFIYDIKKAGTMSSFVLQSRMEIFNFN